MKRQKVKTSVLVCFLIVVFLTGCVEEGAYREIRRDTDSYTRQRDSRNSDPIASELRKIREEMEWQETHRGWERTHEGLRRATEKLNRLNKELELENSMRIKRMQLMLKQREAERKLQELNRQRNR